MKQLAAPPGSATSGASKSACIGGASGPALVPHDYTYLTRVDNVQSVASERALASVVRTIPQSRHAIPLLHSCRVGSS